MRLLTQMRHLLGRPGETFVYRNVHAILAGEVIKRVSGESWGTFTCLRALKLLGMSAATLTVTDLQKQRNKAIRVA